MLSKLEQHRETWKKKKILRDIYIAWYKEIIGDLSPGKGKTIELGSGSGNFKEFKPDTISSDIEYCSWLDIVFDAHRIPFKESSVQNIVMIDVLHHLADPVSYFEECLSALDAGGRVVIIEPFPTLFSLFIYRRFHPEPFIMNVDLFKEKKSLSSVEQEVKKDPWDSNQAIAYLLFFKGKKKFREWFGNRFRVLKRKRISCILYPGSGGFENPSMIPSFLVPFFKVLEILCVPFRWLLAFRCYVVLEKK